MRQVNREINQVPCATSLLCFRILSLPFYLYLHNYFIIYCHIFPIFSILKTARYSGSHILASNAFLYRRLMFADFPYLESLRTYLLVTRPQTPEIVTCGNGCVLFFRLPGICHNFVNVSLWLPAFAAGYFIYNFSLQNRRPDNKIWVRN